MAKLSRIEKKFLRLASARADVYYARRAYQLIQQCQSEAAQGLAICAKCS